jgi:threonine dehydrogenase-like Zn-dependent dehydrogenase
MPDNEIKTMRAVVFKGPGKVVVEDRPLPVIQKPTDVILKVSHSGLCGSDLVRLTLKRIALLQTTNV